MGGGVHGGCGCESGCTESNCDCQWVLDVIGAKCWMLYCIASGCSGMGMPSRFDPHPHPFTLPSSSPPISQIGEVTSGAFSPTLKQNIAMGYVHKDFAKAGTEVQVVVRGKVRGSGGINGWGRRCRWWCGGR